jgi:hypothetical protein
VVVVFVRSGVEEGERCQRRRTPREMRSRRFFERGLVKKPSDIVLAVGVFTDKLCMEEKGRGKGR